MFPQKIYKSSFLFFIQNFDQPCGKQEKLQRKPISKKSKPQSIPPVPCIDYKDNYEGDCDDDDYDKEKQNNPNRWKTSSNRSSTKHHVHTLRTVESSLKLPRQNKNQPRKEKTVQKRRVADKTHIKCMLFICNVTYCNKISLL